MHCVSNCVSDCVSDCVSVAHCVETVTEVHPALVVQPMAYHEWVTPVVYREHRHVSHMPSHSPHNRPERSSRANFLRRDKKYYYRDLNGQQYSWYHSKNGQVYGYNNSPFV